MEVDKQEGSATEGAKDSKEGEFASVEEAIEQN